MGSPCLCAGLYRGMDVGSLEEEEEMKKQMRKALTNAMYLKCYGWAFKQIKGNWGWVDPKSSKHYIEEDALLMQLIRDSGSKSIKEDL